ncbi:MAG TPA: PHP domain-containing protein [Syntrophorhabdaceae bacterium]|nr:PHP domain-containing protein [Syntrophorhabdaceae bacterium]HOL05679.1 PHP domain-containing protein [Syntrophorhabdaceae bacterium]HPP42245.1 PHP domain-containing protein [Syntrophorhabdaceae bacterium]
MSGFSCDLHIHSTLSPCASLEMSPKNIALKAKDVGLDIIAITDHNMTENSIYAHEIGRKIGLAVLFGMELQTQEEIHLLAIFDDYNTAMKLQKKVYSLLPHIKNDVNYFGDQVVVDENDEILRFEDRLLLNSSQISIEDAVAWIKAHGGIAIPSHIDSTTFSIISQLGFIPDNIPFDALEIRNRDHIPDMLPFIMKKDITFVTFSDAHYLNDIGKKRTVLSIQEPRCIEIESALKLMANSNYNAYL